MMHRHDTTGSRFRQLKLRRIVMVRSAIIPAGSWPRRMPAAIAAGYCGELTVEAFLKRVGTEYPQPRVKEGRRQLWLRDDLDRAIAPSCRAKAAERSVESLWNRIAILLNI